MSDTVTLLEQHQAAEKLIQAYHAAVEEKQQVSQLEKRKRELESELKEYIARQSDDLTLNRRQHPFSVLYKGWLFLFYRDGAVRLVKAAGSAPSTTVDLPLFDAYIQAIKDLTPYREPTPDPAEKAYKEAVSHYLSVVKERAFIHENYLILQENGVTIQPLDLKI